MRFIYNNYVYVWYSIVFDNLFATDYGTQLSLFTHHMWIGGFLIVGAAAHAAIFMVRDVRLGRHAAGVLGNRPLNGRAHVEVQR